MTQITSHSSVATAIHSESEYRPAPKIIAGSRPRRFARYAIYPLSWCLLIVFVSLVSNGMLAPKSGWLIFVVTLLSIYLVLERVLPLQQRWAMTWRSFLSDLKYLFANGITLAAFSTFLGLFAITTSGLSKGPASDWPFGLQLIALILIFEALQYGLHRFEHEGGGRFGSFMWRIHSAHHLPERVYLVMHVAGHPINAMLVQGAITIVPIWLMGYSELAIAIFLMINSMHGLISHFNVDVRLGWMNYVFIGPELHRYHHGANRAESKNYGATITLFDLLFGSFVYKPGQVPDALGVKPQADEATVYPAYGEFWKVMALPWR